MYFRDHNLNHSDLNSIERDYENSRAIIIIIIVVVVVVVLSCRCRCRRYRYRYRYCCCYYYHYYYYYYYYHIIIIVVIIIILLFSYCHHKYDCYCYHYHHYLLLCSLLLSSWSQLFIFVVARNYFMSNWNAYLLCHWYAINIRSVCLVIVRPDVNYAVNQLVQGPLSHISRCCKHSSALV